MLRTPLMLNNSNNFPEDVLNSEDAIDELRITLSPSIPITCTNHNATHLKKVMPRVSKIVIELHQDTIFFQNTDLLTYLRSLQNSFIGSECEIIFYRYAVINTDYFEYILLMLERNPQLQHLTIVGLDDDAIKEAQFDRLYNVLTRENLRLQSIRIEEFNGVMFPFPPQIEKIISRINFAECQKLEKSLWEKLYAFNLLGKPEQQLFEYVTGLKRISQLSYGKSSSQLADFIFFRHIELLEYIFTIPNLRLELINRGFDIMRISEQENTTRIDLNIQFFFQRMREIVEIVGGELSPGQRQKYLTQIVEYRTKIMIHCENLNYYNFYELMRDFNYLRALKYPEIDDITILIFTKMASTENKTFWLTTTLIKFVASIVVTQPNMLNEKEVCMHRLFEQCLNISSTLQQMVDVLSLIEKSIENKQIADIGDIRKRFIDKVATIVEKITLDEYRNDQLVLHFRAARHVLIHGEDVSLQILKIYFYCWLEYQKLYLNGLLAGRNEELISSLQKDIVSSQKAQDIFTVVYRFIIQCKDNYIRTEIGELAYNLYLLAKYHLAQFNVNFTDISFSRFVMQNKMFGKTPKIGEDEEAIEMEVFNVSAGSGPAI